MKRINMCIKECGECPYLTELGGFCRITGCEVVTNRINDECPLEDCEE